MAEAPELESSIRDAYIRGVLAEMERDIRRRALSRVQVITRSMAPAEEEAAPAEAAQDGEEVPYEDWDDIPF